MRSTGWAAVSSWGGTFWPKRVIDDLIKSNDTYSQELQNIIDNVLFVMFFWLWDGGLGVGWGDT